MSIVDRLSCEKSMAHYERDYARGGDRDRKMYDRQRYYNHGDHHGDRGRPVMRTSSQGGGMGPGGRDYPSRIRDPPPKRDLVPEFRRELLENQKEQVLLATVPYEDRDVHEHPICRLLVRSAENQERVIRAIERLADVLRGAGDFVAACSEATAAATKAEKKRSDLDGRVQFLNSLNQGILTTSVETFFSLPDAM